MAKNKQKSAIKFAISIFAVLLVANLIIAFTKPQPKPFKEAIVKSIAARSDIDPRRREQLIIQAAIADWMSKNGGKPPESLNILVPTYFDKVPQDPATSKPFSYKVAGAGYKVGEDGEKAASSIQLATADAVALQESSVIKALHTDNSGFVYDTTGKRDPFSPFNFAPKLNAEGLTELERYSIGQLRLTAVLLGFDNPKAIVQSVDGKGFTVQIGTKMGHKSGEVVAIEQDKITIVESSVDFTGAEKSNTIELKLRLPSEDSAPTSVR